MARRFAAALALMLLCLGTEAQTQEKYLLGGWKFHQGPAEGAEAVSFDDSRWERVAIPHDWAVSGPFDKEHDKQSVAIVQNGETLATEKTGRSGALPWIGEGWYRLNLDIPEGYPHAELVFDGAMSEPRVFVDGREAGRRAYGYSTFSLDVSDRLTPGAHVLAVHLSNVRESSRWYPGAGLYRPVRLLLSQESGFGTFGIFARTEAADSAKATVLVSSELRARGGSLAERHTLSDAEGRIVAMAGKKASDGTDIRLEIKNPALWSPETPTLYTLVSELYDDGRLVDRRSTKIGIRSISYGPDGFRLNGQLRKFKGVCLHHDLGPLGAAFNKSAFRRQVRLLKEIGCDAIRTSHNMPAPWQMDICDEMGMMVMAESFDMWRYPKCLNGYNRFFDEWWERDLGDLVKVNRNHPCIVMWSIGNEIPEQSGPEGLELSVRMQELVHSLDPTRPCTQGLDKVDEAIASGVLAAMDVPGCNYRLHYYRDAHEASPDGIVLGSETVSSVSSRGVYKFPVVEEHERLYDDGQISSYDLRTCVWGNLPDDDWMWQDKAPWVIGEFVWSGFDYLGEPTPYDEYWPSRSSYFGIYDLAGLPKDRAFLYRIHWAPEKETLHILPHWTWPGREGLTTPVFCYTSWPEAELFINGKSQGRRKRIDVGLDEYESGLIDALTPWGAKNRFIDPDIPEHLNRLNRYRLRWMDAVYEPGEITVVAYDEDGRPAASETVRTAGKPHHIVLEADRSVLAVTPTGGDGMPEDCPDLAFITAKVVDRDGNLCPDAANLLEFTLEGHAARINSCCNGDPTSLEPLTGTRMKAFHGMTVVVVEALDRCGKVTVSARSKGLGCGKAKLEVR